MNIFGFGGGLMDSRLICLSLFLSFCHHVHTGSSKDAIYPGQSLSGNQTITSASGVFELGYFPLGNPSRFYIGIWYKKIPSDRVVWVANRDTALQDTTAELKISDDGNLVILTQSKSLVWSSNLNSSPSASSRSALLLNSGNLVLRDRSSSGATIIWDSFSYPTNTWLPGGRLGVNMVTKQKQVLASWRNEDDPSPGPYSLEVGTNESGLYFAAGSKIHQYWISALSNGVIVSRVHETRANFRYTFSFFSNNTFSNLTFEVNNYSVATKYVIGVNGQLKHMTWYEDVQSWDVLWMQPGQQCEVYALCGAFGVCSEDTCKCIDGFEPASRRDSGWSRGCVRKAKLECLRDQFYVLPKAKKLDDSAIVSMGTLEECKSVCLNDCSCTAYSYRGSRCSTWKGDILDLQQRSAGTVEDMYIRVSRVESSRIEGGRKKILQVIKASVAITLVAMLCLIGVYIFWRCKTKITVARTEAQPPISSKFGEMKEVRVNELPFLELRVVTHATNNFSESNKLGEGGFGSVYRGKLAGDQEVAVKRLSKGSNQGLEEFKNEVRFIANLQHRNLVQLLGCCLDAEEKLLIYEYMPNKSLDKFIFDPTKKDQLDWVKRFDIVMGIAQGLRYLHEESRLKVIHRDLKTSNILLDSVMNPRISDFGLARIFGSDQTKQQTSRVVGTYGYMPPEYALEGLYSTKSDVFSFGVIVLEIVSGQKMTTFHNVEYNLNLLGHAWKLWTEGKGVDLLDPVLGESFELGQVMRCISVGLLCVQENAEDRPTMSSLLFMLNGDSSALAAPKQPAYLYRSQSPKSCSSPLGNEPGMQSLNGITYSLFDPR